MPISPPVVTFRIALGISSPTTIYQAALCAGLQIVERRPHSEKVRYTELGLDATVYLEKGSKHNKDFRFKNNTDGDIYIFATVEKDPTEKKKNRLRTRVDIYGPYMGDVHYELQSTRISSGDINHPFKGTSFVKRSI